MATSDDFRPSRAAEKLYEKFWKMSQADRVDFELLLLMDQRSNINKFLGQLHWVIERGNFRFPKSWKLVSRIVHMRDVEGKTFEAIGPLVDMETDAVEKAYHRRKKLEARLARPPQDE